MSESKHTPGKLVIEPVLWDEEFGRVGCIVAVTMPGHLGNPASKRAFRIGRATDDQVDVDQEANARRLVACWNACDGINPEAVKPMLEALNLIAKGTGTFSRDQLTFATNVIEESKAIAQSAIALAEGDTDAT